MFSFVAGKLKRWLQHRHLAWHLAALGMLLCAPSLWLGWQTDDYIHRAALTRPEGAEDLARSPAELFAFIAGDEEANRHQIASGYLPWWAHPQLRLAFFRPLTGLTHWVDYVLWPETPWLMHLQSLLWFGATLAAATMLYRRMFGGVWIAGFAALLFAVDDAHGLPAVWLANRNATIGAFFGIVTLIAHDRWRRDGRGFDAVLAPAALLLGLLANEAAVAVAGYLAAYAFFLDGGTRLYRARTLVAYAIVLVGWWVCYKLLGYGASGSGMYVDPGASPLRFAEAAIQRAPILLLAQWVMPVDIHLVLSARGVHLLWMLAMAFAALLGGALAPLIRRDRLARFWAVGMLLSLLPACATFPSRRLLFFAGLGGMALLAQFASGLFEHATWTLRRRSWRWPANALCAVLLFVALVVAPLALNQAAAGVRRFGGVLRRAARSLPADPAVREQTLLIVTTPTYFVSVFGSLIQAFEGRPYPARTFVLGSSIYTTEIRRPDERTLLIRPAGGFLLPPGRPPSGKQGAHPLFDVRYAFPMFDQLFRDDRPMQVGERIALDVATVEVTAVTPAGRPAEAAFRFSAPLESPGLRWVRWADGVYVPFAPPGVGRAVTLPSVEVGMFDR